MRRFLCLLLVLCLMASLFAIPASATAVTTATFDGLAAVAAMIAGSGVTINAIENFPVFNTLVSSVFDHLTAQNIIDTAGTISALVSGQKTYIPASVVQSVKDYLFDSNTIVEPYPYAESATIINPSKGVDSETTTYTSATPIYVYYFKAINRYGNLWFYGLAISETNLFYNGNDLKRNYDTPGVSTNDLTYVREAP